MSQRRYDSDYGYDERQGAYSRDADYYDDSYRPQRRRSLDDGVTHRSAQRSYDRRERDEYFERGGGYVHRNSLQDRSRRNQSRQDEYDDYYDRRDDRSSEFSSGFKGMYAQHTAPAAPSGKRGSGSAGKVVMIFLIALVAIATVVVVSTIKPKDAAKERTVMSDSTVSGSTLVTQTDVSSDTDEQEEQQMDRAEQIVSGMSTEEKVGQLLLIRGDSMTEQDFCTLITDCKVGGVVLFKKDFEGKSKSDVRDYIERLQSAGNGKMLVCVDEEGGTVVRLSGLTALRSEKYKSPQDVYKAGGFDGISADAVNKCEFLKGFGINVNFGPVSDVVTNKKGFLYKRAFGKKAEETAKYVTAVVTAMDENGVGSSLKHFPGYGNSTGDTHKGLDHNTKSLAALKKSDLVPFKAGVDAGADSIMVTHTVIDKVDKKNPASMSEKCISIIRDYLKFDGVVITDGLDMGAVIEFCGKKDPCVQCITGGCDMLCTPQKAAQSYKSLLNAVKDGTISKERLDKSVTRIIKWKIKLGLYD